MSKEQTNISGSNNSIKSNKMEKKQTIDKLKKSKLRKTNGQQSDSDNSDSEENETEYVYDDNESISLNKQLDFKEFQKFLYEKYPSKYLKSKIAKNNNRNSNVETTDIMNGLMNTVEPNHIDQVKLNTITKKLMNSSTPNPIVQKNRHSPSNVIITFTTLPSKKTDVFKNNVRSKNIHNCSFSKINDLYHHNSKDDNDNEEDKNKDDDDYDDDDCDYDDYDDDDDEDDDDDDVSDTITVSSVSTLSSISNASSISDTDFNINENIKPTTPTHTHTPTSTPTPTHTPTSTPTPKTTTTPTPKTTTTTTTKKRKHLESPDTTTSMEPVIENNNNFVYEQLKQAYKNHPKTHILKKLLSVCKNEMKQSSAKQVKYMDKQRTHNMKIFHKILYGTQHFEMNDHQYFKKAPVDEQKNIIRQAKSIHAMTKVDKPYRILIFESNMPVHLKSHAMKKISILESSDTGSSEYNKNKQWVDNFMRIPFHKYHNLPISTTDSPLAISDFIKSAKNTLDDTIYGMNDAKMQIMQMIGQLITNPSSIGTAIGLCGPPGVGKTTLIKDGVSKILNRPFAMIALGGATDSSFLEGHSYTYEGSIWGRLVQILIDSKCMNPIIYFGELDKVSQSARGEEIIGILTHLTDTTQNMQFHDKYFSEIDFDFSKVMFIFDYNDELMVNPILRDRLYKIYAKEYTTPDKRIITDKYLLPKIRTELKFNENEIIIPEQTITYIVDNYCDKEKGVRNLKRCLEIIHQKLNLLRLLQNGTENNKNIFGKDLDIKNFHFPFIVEPTIIDKLLMRTSGSNTSHLLMYS